uniref:Uncharacterized protein n=1 Tax=Chenopodium quinoa TaxID=63459 RepID=A0A803MN64_CHEQI
MAAEEGRLKRRVAEDKEQMLKPILGELVGEFQNAFVPRRLMTDSAMIGHELIHSIKKRRRHGKPFTRLMNVDRKLEVYRGDSSKIAIPGAMDSMDPLMCYNGNLFCPGQWRTIHVVLT